MKKLKSTIFIILFSAFSFSFFISNAVVCNFFICNNASQSQIESACNNFVSNSGIGQPAGVSYAFGKLNCAVCYNGGTCATPPTEPSCTLGTYSSTGYAPCTDAPIGTYVDTIGATSPKNCPSGKTTNQIKSTSSSQCVATACVVPAGYSEEYIIDKETYSVKLGYGVFDFGALTIPAGDYNFLLIGGGGGGGGTRGNGDNRPGGSGASGGCDSTFISSIETFYPEYRLGRGGRPSKFSFNSSNFCSYAGSISTTPGVTTTLRYLGVDYNAGGGGGGCVSGSDSGARSSGDTQCYTIAKGGTPNGVDGVVGGNRNSYSPNAGGDNGTGYGKGGDSNGMTGSAICPKEGDFGAIIVSKKCNPGTYKSNTGKGVCTPCPTGKTSIAGATSLNQCVDSTCPAGSIGLNGKAPCSKCQRGTYQDATGQQQCKDAGVDKYVDTEGATQPINCPSGKTTRGVTRATTSEQCFTRNTAPAAPTITGASYIQSGTQYDIRLNTTDAEGDKVRYNVNWGDNTSGTAPSSHNPFAVNGYIAPTDSTWAGQEYNSTGRKTISVTATDNNTNPLTSTASTKTIIVYNCARGTYYNTSLDSCSPCDSGTYNTTAGVGRESCTPCPAGTYTQGQAGQASCTQCPAGTFGTNGSSCGTCPANTYSTGGASSCTACLSGQTSTSGASSCTTVVTTSQTPTCQPGSAPINGVCTQCLQGTYSSDGRSCISCPNGQTSFEGASSCSTLVDICPAPNTCQKGYERVNGTCNKCLQGTYSANGLKCLPCENGKTSFEGAAECTILPGTCPKPPLTPNPTCSTNQSWNGTSCVNNGGGGGGGNTCKLGQYISGNNCNDCPAGTYGANPPGVGQGSCTQCSANTYSTGGATSCTSCQSGQTSPAGSTSASACINKPISPPLSCSNKGEILAGDSDGTNICKKCSYAQQADKDNKSCEACPAGWGRNENSNYGCIEIIKYFYANPNKVLAGAKSKLYYDIDNTNLKKLGENVSCSINNINKVITEVSNITGSSNSETSRITDPTKYELSCINTTPVTTNVNVYSRGEV